MLIRTSLAIGVLALGLAACGGGASGDDDGIASAGNEPSTSASAKATGDAKTEQQHIIEYVKCMRENGINMADPEFEDGGGVKMMMPDGTDDKKVQAAEQKCRALMPNGGEPPKASPEQLERSRKMSQCMRENGVPDFPDPDENGGIRIESKAGDGLDPNSDKFKQADKICREKLGPFEPGTELKGKA